MKNEEPYIITELHRYGDVEEIGACGVFNVSDQSLSITGAIMGETVKVKMSDGCIALIRDWFTRDW